MNDQTGSCIRLASHYIDYPGIICLTNHGLMLVAKESQYAISGLRLHMFIGKSRLKEYGVS